MPVYRPQRSEYELSDSQLWSSFVWIKNQNETSDESVSLKHSPKNNPKKNEENATNKLKGGGKKSADKYDREKLQITNWSFKSGRFSGSTVSVLSDPFLQGPHWAIRLALFM